MPTSVRYSPGAGKAAAFLKRQSNDIDIFVEDTKNRNMWLSLLRCLLPQGTRLTSVTMLGGRERVLAECRNDQTTEARPKLYIIDADMDYMLALEKPRLKYLYRLRAYCVENIILNEHTALRVAMLHSVSGSESEIGRKLDFDNWISDARKALEPVFATYAVATMVAPSIKTVKRGAHGLFQHTASGVVFSRKKCIKRAIEVARECCGIVGYERFLAEYSEVKCRIRGLSTNQIISGKDYLFPAFVLVMRKRFRVSGDPEQVKVMLAAHCNDNAEPWLRNRVRVLIESEDR